MDSQKAQVKAVEDLLSAYRVARDQSRGQPWRAEVINDVRRSAAAARDALKVVGSPLQASFQEFLDGTEREDTYLRIKRAGNKGFEAANTVGTLAGIPSLQGISWFVVIGAAILGAVVGFFLVINIAIAIVAALPIGFIAARAPTLISQAGKSLTDYVSRPNEARQLIQNVVAPAEVRFFTLFTGRPPIVRTTALSSAAEKGAVAAVAVAALIGGLIGALLAASQTP